ncbi:MAG: hypothetical protein EOO60_13550 [Hymenobacter sp.]|nr:MAG: hypothetical protein EOO60_13550 [Hymenobacter sp.]
MNNYWIMRTDRRTDEIREFIWQELQQGRLRQGWAWKDEQSLTVIDSMANTDMTNEQKESWRGNRRMLQSHGDGIKPGDIILVPHVPHKGVWSIVRRLDAPYQFDRTNPFKDYGHTLAVEHLSTTRPVSFHEEAVSAHLRSTMRNPMRMWNIGRLSAEVERLISALQNNHSSENVYNRIPHFFNQVELAA